MFGFSFSRRAPELARKFLSGLLVEGVGAHGVGGIFLPFSLFAFHPC